MAELGIVVHTDPGPDGSTRIGVMGPLTRTTAPALREALRSATKAWPATPAPHVNLDLACCTGIDVDGLLALSVGQQALQDHSGDLHLQHAPPLIERYVRQHNFHDLLPPDQPQRTRRPSSSTDG